MSHRRSHYHHFLGWSLFFAAVILLIGALGVGAITYEHAYEGRIFPGVRIGPVVVGGLNKTEAAMRLQKAVDAYLNNGIPYTIGGKLVRINAIISSPQESDLSYTLIDVNVPALVEEAYSVGRHDALRTAWSERVRGVMGDELAVPIHAAIDEARLQRALEDNFRDVIPPMKSPQLQLLDRDGVLAWRVSEGRPGERIHIAAVLENTSERVASLDPAPVILLTQTELPAHTKAEIEAVLPAFQAVLQRAPLKLMYGESSWDVDQPVLAAWLTIGDGPKPVLDPSAVDKFLLPIAKEIEQPAENARFAINPATKRVREFRAPLDGVRIDKIALYQRLEQAVFGGAVPLISIPVIVEAPRVALGDVNDLGIKELLGVGKTNFKGSPPNRRHNIGVGSGLLNGVLIAPDEIFSTVAAVSPVDATNGYKPELVIKEGKTIPEFGGGLCQVSTTLFRAVLAAGLPVIERANHAYRVPYYEPPVGMDATIYTPKPDFRFKNDTGHYLLLRTRIEGDNLSYEFWGTKDGRTAVTSEPEVYNFVAPPLLKEVETESLPPGQKKCTERAHTGADAKFTYTVTYADGRVATVEFKSHFRPWQAVCLIGKKPTTDSQQSIDSGNRATTVPAGTADVAPMAPPTVPAPIHPSSEAPPLSGGN